MRVLLDEQLPRQLSGHLEGHEVRTVQQQRWAGTKNGELLRLAVEAGFESFLTADHNLEYQQNLQALVSALAAEWRAMLGDTQAWRDSPGANPSMRRVVSP